MAVVLMFGWVSLSEICSHHTLVRKLVKLGAFAGVICPSFYAAMLIGVIADLDWLNDSSHSNREKRSRVARVHDSRFCTHP